MSARTTVPVTTPKVAAKAVKDLDPRIVKGLTEAFDPAKGLKGADIARVLVATGHLTTKANTDKSNGLALRTYMRAHGAYVGKGNTYGATVAEASKIAYGFVNDVAPPKGGAFVKGLWIPTPTKGEAAEA